MVRRIGLLAGVAAALVVAPLAAQGQGVQQRGMGGRMMASPSMDELKTALTLTDAQVPKIQALIAKYDEDIKEPRETMMQNMQMVRDGSVSQESVREANMAAMAKIRERRDKLNDEIKGVLDATQKAAFEKYLAEQAQRGPQGRRPPA